MTPTDGRPVVTFSCELAWLGGEDVGRDVLIAVEDGRITAVTAGVAEPPAGVLRLSGLTVPGLANGHSHAFHRALRGRTATGASSFWSWRERMYALAERLEPDSYFRLARATYGEMVRAGITTVGEFHYLHHQPGGRPYPDPNEMGNALVAAAGEAGLRLTLLDTCYLHGGIGLEATGVQRRFSDGDAATWAARVDALPGGPEVRVGAAVHSVRAVDLTSLAAVAGWAAERGAPLHAHVSEQPAENEQCRAAYGCSPTELLAGAGVLGERFTAVHATHVSPADVAALGAAGASCCFCPTTERDLADGIGPARALVDAGARLTLGSDSHAVIDPWEEARAVELHERLASGERGRLAPSALLDMATGDGQASLGWPDAGRIAPGALADLTTISGDSVRTAGLAADPLGLAVFAATAADVHHVVVGGRVVVREGRHVTLDVEAELGEVLR